VGSKLAEQMITCLTDGGKMLLYGTLGGAAMARYSPDLMMANATIGGFYMPGWLAAQALQVLNQFRAMRCLRHMKMRWSIALGLLFRKPINHAVRPHFRHGRCR
jgi:hypothetical protein